MKKGKKFTALFLAFSLMMLSVNLYAKERRGAELIIQRKSERVEKTRLEGTPWETSVITGIWGELIAVKQNSLLLLDAGGKDVTVDIADIKVIKIKKKSMARQGFLAGGIAGAIIGYATYKEPTDGFIIDFGPGLSALAGGIAGGLIGLVVGTSAGKGKTIHFEGMTDSEIRETLAKLRKKARVRDYK